MNEADDKGHPTPIEALLALMTRLRDRENGCPWDAVQTFATIAPYTIEEAYEVADAIAREDLAGLEEELGDLLLQVVFHAEMAREAGAFDFDSVARKITDKMHRRHPHVFGDAAKDGDLRPAWEAMKARERRDKAGTKATRIERAGRGGARPARPDARPEASGTRGPRRFRLAGHGIDPCQGR